MDISKEIKNASREMLYRIRNHADFLIAAPFLAYAYYCFVSGCFNAAILSMFVGYGAGGLCLRTRNASRPAGPRVGASAIDCSSK